jgi:hypothetical protein
VRLNWASTGERFFESGVDRGVVYPNNSPGIVWDGIISVSESPSGGEPRPYFIDGKKYLNVASSEEFEAEIEAYSPPDGFPDFDGLMGITNGLFIGHQRRFSFGFCYRTMIGSDSDLDYGYKLHLVYRALISPTSRDNATLGDSISPTSLSWNITTSPERVIGIKPTAHFVVDSTRANPLVVETLETILYGDDLNDPRLPPATELVTLFS